MGVLAGTILPSCFLTCMLSNSGMYLESLSSIAILPSSTSLIAAMQVVILVFENIQYISSADVGFVSSASE